MPTRLLLPVWLMVVGISIVGCGEQAPTDQLRESALQAYHAEREFTKHISPSEYPEAFHDGHRKVAGGLDILLERHPDASDGLRSLLVDLRDGEQQLASGRLGQAEAEALRKRQQEYWLHLENETLPPDYR